MTSKYYMSFRDGLVCYLEYRKCHSSCVAIHSIFLLLQSLALRQISRAHLRLSPLGQEAAVNVSQSTSQMMTSWKRGNISMSLSEEPEGCIPEFSLDSEQ